MEKDKQPVDKLNETNMLLEGIFTTLNKDEETPILEHILLKLDELGNKGVQEVKLVGAEIEKIKGEKGDTPKKGVDYYTKKEKEELIKEIKQIKGKDYFTEDEIEKFLKAATPKKGIDYIDGKDGYTPVKGKDYFDGKDGKNGQNGINGKDGKDGINGKNGNDGSPDTPKQVKEKLLKQGLSIDEIKDVPDFHKIAQLYSTKSSRDYDFLELKDTPKSYTGQALKSVRVNAGETALEFFSGSGFVDWGEIGGTLANQADLQAALDAKQATLISGTNIKTINGATLLGSGDIVIDATVTLADLSANSTTAPLSLYTMTSTIPVEFRSSDGNSLLYLNETSEYIRVGVSALTEKFSISGANNDTFGILRVHSTGGALPNSGISLTTDIAGSSNRNWQIVTNYATAGTFEILRSTSNGGSPTTNVLTILNTGVIGIGTGSTVSAKLHVISTTEQLRLGYDASNRVSFTVNSAGALNISPTGAGVGIGTTTPTALFQVTQNSTGNGTVATNGTTTLTGTNTLFTKYFRVGDTINVSGETTRVISSITSDTVLVTTVAFSTTASSLTYTISPLIPANKLNQFANGNLVIGPIDSTTTTALSNIVGSTTLFTLTGTQSGSASQYAQFRFSNTGNNSGSIGTYYANAANAFSIVAGGVTAITALGSGNVGIGTTAPVSKLHISTGVDTDSGVVEMVIGGSNGANARTGRIIKDTTTAYTMILRSGDYAGTGLGSDLRFQTNNGDGDRITIKGGTGNVGIGVSPTHRLDAYLSSSSTGVSTIYGLRDIPSGTISSGSSINGIFGQVTISGSSTVSNVIPTAGRFIAEHDGSSTVGGVYGVYAHARTNAASTGVLANAYSLYAVAPNNNQAGNTITNAYSLYIESPTAGATLNYSLFQTGTAMNRLGGSLGIGADPVAKLHTIATTEQYRNGYDTSNYMSVTTGSTGITTFNLTGTSPYYNFNTGILRGDALHNNALAQGSATQQDIRSGTYTPTLTGVTNVAASTAYPAQWMRVGNVVTVSGSIDVDPTAAGNTQIRISLPVASNLAFSVECAGSIGTNSSAVTDDGVVIGDATNNEALAQWVAVDVGNRNRPFIFMYQVI